MFHIPTIGSHIPHHRGHIPHHRGQIPVGAVGLGAWTARGPQITQDARPGRAPREICSALLRRLCCGRALLSLVRQERHDQPGYALTHGGCTGSAAAASIGQRAALPRRPNQAAQNQPAWARAGACDTPPAPGL
jgi:hypothetical protein